MSVTAGVSECQCMSVSTGVGGLGKVTKSVRMCACVLRVCRGVCLSSSAVGG